MQHHIGAHFPSDTIARIPLKCGPSCHLLNLTLGPVVLGLVLDLGRRSCLGLSFMWADLPWAEFVLCRVVLHPLFVASILHTRLII